MGYLAAPALGLTVDTASIVSAVAAAPVAAKVVAKTTLAFPFVFHCLNGVRHLVSGWIRDQLCILIDCPTASLL
jgi:succinate dehydrogenase (ubiquinone) cytochrome b560 subunit